MQGLRQVRPVDPLLTDYAISWRQSHKGFIADALYPRVLVKGDTGTYYVWEAANVMTIRNSQWAKGAEAPEVVLRATSATFQCKKYGFRTAIDDDDRENVIAPFSLDVEATESLTELMLLDRERRVFDAVNALTTDFDITVPLNRQWDESASTPFADIETGKSQIQVRTGKLPNLIVMGRTIYNSLRTNSGAGTAGLQIQERIKYGPDGGLVRRVNEELLAQAFDVERVVVADVVYDAGRQTSTISGTGNASGAYLWSDNLILAYVEPTPTTRSVSFAKSFTSFDLAALPSYRVEGREADILRTRMKVDEKQTMRNCAYLIKDVLA